MSVYLFFSVCVFLSSVCLSVSLGDFCLFYRIRLRRITDDWKNSCFCFSKLFSKSFNLFQSVFSHIFVSVNCSDRDNVEEDKSNKRIFQNVEIEIHLVKNKKNKKNRKIIFYFSFEHFLVTDSKACLPNLFNDLKGFCLFTDTDICRTKINGDWSGGRISWDRNSIFHEVEIIFDHEIEFFLTFCKIDQEIE